MRGLQSFQSYFAQPQALLLLGVLPLLWAVGIMGYLRRQRALAQLASPSALESLTYVGHWRRVLVFVCGTLALALTAVAVASPQWGYDPEPALAPGRDLVVVLDVSRSMLAEDILPSRVEWAKQALSELVDDVARRGGHRLGLVAFAGRSRVVCPLTPDCDHVREALRTLDPRDARYAPVPGEGGPASGTRIGAALVEAVQLHEPRFRDFQDILLLSDGDDPARDDEWKIGVQAARNAGIPIHVVGIGDPQTDSVLLDELGRPIRFGEQKVLTRLHEEPLEQIARLSGGSYLSAWNERRSLGDWFRAWTRLRPGHDFGDEPLPALVARHNWFFGPALALFVLATLVSDRPSSRWGRYRLPTESVVAAGWLIPLALLLAGASPSSDAERWVRKGNNAFERGEYDLALEYFGRAEENTTDPGLVALNEAAAFYRLGRFREAELHYLRSLEDASGERRVRTLYDLGVALIQGCQGKDADMLDRAIASLEACLREPQLTPELGEDAEHNLRVAQALRQGAKAAPKRPSGDSGKTPPDEEPRDGRPSREGTDRGGDSTDGRAPFRQGNSAARAKDGTPISAEHRQPGTGNLPPIPDTDEVRPLAPEDALAHLRQATQRILDDLENQKRQTTRPTRNVLDW